MPSQTWKGTPLAMPGVSVSLLPNVVCPICSPAYAAVLSSLGLGFLISTRYLLPITIVFLTVAVGALAFRASGRRGLRPFWTGVMAATGVLVGKFWLDSATITYAGVSLLVFASVWNMVPRPACSCLPADAGLQRREGDEAEHASVPHADVRPRASAIQGRNH